MGPPGGTGAKNKIHNVLIHSRDDDNDDRVAGGELGLFYLSTASGKYAEIHGEVPECTR